MSPVALVAAVARNGVIGRQNRMPWHLPADLAYFRQLTWGHTVVMGRLTFASLGRPLPGRENVVVSRDEHYHPEGVLKVGSLDAALALEGKGGELMVIGGASLYAQALSRASRLYLTYIDGDVEGDTFFPHWDRTEWCEMLRETHSADGRHPWPYAFTVWERLP